MKIVYFVDHLRADGTQLVLEQLAHGLAVRGHQQAVICLNDSADNALVDRLRIVCTDVRIVGKVALAGGYGLVSIWQWLRRERFDVAVTLLFTSDVIGRALARVASVPRIVSSLRARNVHYTIWQRWLVRRTMRWADAIVLNSAAVRDFAIAEEGAQPDRIVVIRNGVQVENYCAPLSRAALRAEFGLSPEQCLVGSVGRLTYQKGYDVLLQALALVRRVDVHLLVVGAGDEEASLRVRVDALGLQRRVHFTGYRRDVPRLLGALDLYVHPARFEGMPNALLEAMAAGCPIVATTVDGNRELIEDGVHGWLVPPEDARALAEAIECALVNTDEARRRSTAAQTRATISFSIDSMVGAWEYVLAGER
ncbi:MAG TPA: glycosyltransferase [Herpetosiphonaceae bacterium]|nr:glycosyltransferase [Herpetosiphonaceae bacterium]